jgi:hypothetical protein
MIKRVSQQVLVQFPVCNVRRLSVIPLRNPELRIPMSKGNFVSSLIVAFQPGKIYQQFPFDIGSQYLLDDIIEFSL